MKGCIHIFCTIDEFYEGFVVYIQHDDVFAKINKEIQWLLPKHMNIFVFY